MLYKVTSLQIQNFILYTFSEVIAGVPAIYLEYASKNLPSNVVAAAQNSYKVSKGAFTGKFDLSLLLITGLSRRHRLFCFFLEFTISIGGLFLQNNFPKKVDHLKKQLQKMFNLIW